MGDNSTRESNVDSDNEKVSVLSTASSSVMFIVVHWVSPSVLPMGKVRFRDVIDV